MTDATNVTHTDHTISPQSSAARRAPAFKKALHIAGIVALVLVVLGLLIAWLAPAPVKRLVEEKAGEALGRQVTIGEVSLNPFTLSARVNNFTIAERAFGQTAGQLTPATGASSAFVSIDQIDASISLASLWHFAPVVQSLTVTKPQINLVRESESRFNFTDIIERILAQPKSDTKTLFAVNNIRLVDGNVKLDDRVVSKKHVLSEIGIGIPFISNLPSQAETVVEPSFSAKLNGAPLDVKGKTVPFSDTVESALEVDWHQLDVPTYLGYVPTPLPIKVTRGKLNLDLSLVFRKGSGKIAQGFFIRGAASLSNAAMEDGNGNPLLDFAQLRVSEADIAPLAARYQLGNIALIKPVVNMARATNGSLNWNTAFANNAAKQMPKPLPTKSVAQAEKSAVNAPVKPESAKKPVGKPAIFGFNSITLTDGGLMWSDATTLEKGKPFSASLAKVNMRFGVMQSAKPTEAMPSHASFEAQHGEIIGAVELDGLIKPMDTSADSAFLNLKLNAQKLLPQAFAAYWRNALNLRIDGAVTNIAAVLDLTRQANVTSFTIRDATIESAKSRFFVAAHPASQPASTEPGKKTLNPQAIGGYETLRVSGINVDPSRKSVAIAAVALAAPMIDVRRGAGERWNVLSLLNNPASPQTESKPEVTPATATVTVPTPTAAQSDWQIDIAQAIVADGRVGFADEAESKPVIINSAGVNIAVNGFSTAPNKDAQVQLRTVINKRAKLNIRGTAAAMSRRAALRVDAEELDLAVIEPYASRFLNAQFASGRLTYHGNVNVSAPANSTTSAPLLLGVKGNVLVTDFRAIDKVNAADFLRWKTLAVDGIDVNIERATTATATATTTATATATTVAAPMEVNIGNVTMSDYYARIIVNTDGKLNLQDVMVSNAETPNSVSVTSPKPANNEKTAPAAANATTTAAAASASPAPVIRLGQFTLQGGNVNFTDNFVRPNYTANLTELTGTLSAVASDKPEPATVTLRGNLDGDAPVAIDGRVNPLAKPLFIDMTGSAKGIELTRLSPYAAKYAGYAIDRGKLSVDIKYFVENNQLKAENHVFLDQLTFGERVDSPTATKLPVSLAVALLKNSRGEIDINLPIAGSIDDPKFSVGGIIVQVIVNLLGKAITSPFALLGAAFGGGDELSYIEFAPGSAVLDDAAKKKMETLIKALKDRPALKLDITGRIDPALDAEGARRATLDAAIKTKKLKTLVGRGQSVEADAASVTKEEYPALLLAAYKDAKFAKPRNVIGLAKTLPPEEMEKLMLANTPFTEVEQRALANKRADAIRDALRAALGEQAAERVFLVTPKLNAEGIKDKGRTTRVEFGLR